MASILSILGSELGSLGRLGVGTAMSLNEAGAIIRKIPAPIAFGGAMLLGYGLQAGRRTPLEQVQHAPNPQLAENPYGYTGTGYMSSAQVNKDLGARGDLVFHLKNRNH